MGTLDTLTIKDLAVKQADFSDADTSPMTLWNPPKGRIKINNVVLAIQNKSANSAISIRLEALRKGSWIELAVCGAQNKDFGEMVIDFHGLVRCQELRVRKVGTASSWDSWVMVTGSVEE